MSDYMKEPCEHCPFREDVKPFLTARRGEELAYHTCNPYNSFPCHKTTKSDDEGDTYRASTSKECAGFLSMQINENGEKYKPKGFKVSPLVYEDAWAMTSAYEEANKKKEA